MSDKKSFIAKIEEAILRYTKPKYMDSKEDVDDFLNNKPVQKPPQGIFKMSDSHLYTFGNENAKNTILFVHGGAFVSEMNYQHLLYCLKMSRKLDAHVIAPVYPLAPQHNAMETYDMITEIYEKLDHENLILMGDSAGGGFVLSFAQYLKTVGLPQPRKIIAFSPWVDISMSNSPYDNEHDPILGEIGLKEMGKSWAGDLDTKDYRVSPLYGDVAGQAQTLIFSGTGEIFYKDIEIYVEKLKKCNVDVKFIKGEGLFHIYPLFPSPEAKKAFKEVKKEIIG
ncbi:alpha/beta hydrolase [Methanobrevibacter sp.]|uniref:alpha/beta hydrolase n=1 Tax=Methanobrevibacter sp. TaxID=66852 RepID=UPI002E7A5795|nr:alpha/beta hydrolase [Methanobrevibacter sp.]MEE1335138.1 alpha/beta hydrolase [Methanobrevibacter sp.]